MKQRIGRSNLGIAASLTLALAGIFVACAEGGTETSTLPLDELDGSTDAGPSTSAKDDASVLPPDSCNGVCSSDEVCRDGTCVEINPDDDKDGYRRDVDCDDTDPDVHPGAKEICNGKDDDCNGKIDDGFDQDDDGFSSCASADAGVDASTGSDCDDTNPDIHPGAKEICNGKDDDCNGVVDDIPATLSGSLSEPVDTHWATTGSASITGDWGVLTPDKAGSAGALWWGAVYTFDKFDLSAKFKVVTTSSLAADGLTFAWVQGTGIPAVGGAGSSFAVKGATGYAVVLDMYKNNDESWSAPSVAIYDTKTFSRLSGTPKSIAGLNDGNEHTLRVRLDGGKVTVDVDGTTRLDKITLTNYKPFAGHFGFTAATGDFSEWHGVKDVTMSFPDGQGCVK